MAELARRPTLGTLWQFMRKAEEFINQEETIRALTKAKAEDPWSWPNDVKRELEALLGKKKKNTRSLKAYKKKFKPFRKQNQSLDKKWIPLNTILSTVLMEVRRDPNFRWPAKMRTPPQKRNSQKYWEYHNEHGHLIEHCITLKREIEIFIQNRKLIKFLAGERGRDSNSRGSRPQRMEPHCTFSERELDQRRRRDELKRNWNDQPNPHNQLIIREIYTISSGLTGVDESMSVRKAHARKVNIEEVYLLERLPKIQRRDLVVISFLEKDAEGISMPHDDALVVTMTMANHTIHRILVDNGSSADILYWSVVQQMGVKSSWFAFGRVYKRTSPNN